MSISFPELVIYLLPGFLGLWTFKHIVQEDIDRRSESTQIAIALLLGISAIILLFMLNFILGFISLSFAKYISPNALSLRVEEGREVRLILDGGMEFLVSYIVLCVCAVLSGGMWGVVSEKGLTCTRRVSNFFNLYLKRSIQTPCESAMRALIDEMTETGHSPSLVRIYSLGENRDNFLIGWWDGYSESERELKLKLLECCDAATELSKEFDLQTRRCLVSYESGIVIEFLDIDEHSAASFEKYVKKRYLEILHVS